MTGPVDAIEGEAAAETEASPAADVRPKARSWLKQALRWFVRPPPFGGLIGAVASFVLSMTPSMVPRSWGVQGVLAGLTAAIGYGIGSTVSALVARFRRRDPRRATSRRAWIALGVGAPLVVVAAVAAGARWDRDLRVLMNMPLKDPWEWIGVILVAALLAIMLVFVCRVVRGIGHLLVLLAGRYLPRPVALATGGVVAAVFAAYVVLGGLVDHAFRAANTAAGVVDRTIQPDVVQPTSPQRSGSPASLITWDELGAKGREFTGMGPTVAELSAFAGRPAMQPIRAYAGVRAAGTTEARVELLMSELERMGAFDRSVIIVQTPSGNGHIPPVNAAAPEFMFAGDVAQVVLQYAYVSSVAAMITERDAGDEASRQLIEAVTERVAQMPEDRPRVFVVGESLGSLSTEAAFADLDDLVARVDGALLVGPTVMNPIRNTLTDARDDGTPVWLPVVDQGSIARFAREPADLSTPTGTWGDETRRVPPELE